MCNNSKYISIYIYQKQNICIIAVSWLDAAMVKWPLVGFFNIYYNKHGDKVWDLIINKCCFPTTIIPCYLTMIVIKNFYYNDVTEMFNLCCNIMVVY